MEFSVSKVVTISGLTGIKINMYLIISINIVGVVTDISDRHDTLIFYTEYFITHEITVRSFTAIKISYCISTTFHGVALNMFITQLNSSRTKLSVAFKDPVYTAQ
jgi:S-adenosylmethionine/arginine decarboxylase-like enzyme